MSAGSLICALVCLTDPRYFCADTNIGVDDRNQFQLIESQPGGIAGLRQVVDELHAHGVQALWPYNPCELAGLFTLRPGA